MRFYVRRACSYRSDALVVRAVEGNDESAGKLCSNELFAVAANMLEDSCAGKCGDSAAAFRTELGRYVAHIERGPIIEQARGGAIDSVLVGVMTLAGVLYSADSVARASEDATAFLSYIFQECLFRLPEPKTQGEVGFACAAELLLA